MVDADIWGGGPCLPSCCEKRFPLFGDESFLRLSGPREMRMVSKTETGGGEMEELVILAGCSGTQGHPGLRGWSRMTTLP